MEPVEILKEVAQEVSVCTRCDLHATRKRAVPGEGPADAEIMFIGEGPGYYENEQGRPFVGAAGQFLDELLQTIHLKRSNVFITNVVKCRPPGNRDPETEEISTCTSLYLQRQMDAINPKMIVTLGRFSLGLFLPNARITQVHGKPFQIKEKNRILVPMYHPAAALHQPSLRSAVVADFAQLPKWIAKMNEKMKAAEQPVFEEPPKDDTPPAPTQLSLF